MVNLADMSAATRVSSETGLSLVEVTVALAILALLATVSLPRAPELFERGRASLERDQVELQLRDLASRANHAGQVIELATLPGTGQGEPDVIRLPAGWRLSATPPIHYRRDGVCSGGRVTVTAPGVKTITYVLEPPFCRPVRR
jgi:general secretion pathway protein G